MFTHERCPVPNKIHAFLGSVCVWERRMIKADLL